MLKFKKGVICIFSTKVTVRKHWPVLMILIIGLSTSLIGCSSSPSAKTNSSMPTAAVTTPPSDSTAPPLESTDPASASKTTPSNSAKTTTPTTSQNKANTGAISKIKYNELQYGYTYEKIKGLLGDAGEVVTESGTKGNIGYTVTYHLKTSANGEVFLAFKDNKLVNKMEVNLK